MTNIGIPLLQEEIAGLKTKVNENRKVVQGFSNYIRQAALGGTENLESVIRTITSERDKAETELLVLERELAIKESRLNELKTQNQDKGMRESGSPKTPP